MEGVNSEMILKRMKNNNSQVLSKEALLEWVEKASAGVVAGKKGWVIVTAGAGDIDALVQPIRKVIEKV
jgi:UDP-N-acetylmuramate--alanine ligase